MAYKLFSCLRHLRHMTPAIMRRPFRNLSSGLLVAMVTFSTWCIVFTVYRSLQNGVAIDKARPAVRSPAAIQYVPQSSTQYPGPKDRYKLRKGEWQRLPDSATHSRNSKLTPGILHQTWNHDRLPDLFVPWVLSWLRHHPDWEYWFWTPDDVRSLIHTEYPQFLKTYDSYRLMLSKADAMRYFVLHSYGGVYADLDTECLRPLYDLLDKYPCVLSQETYEHAHLLYKRNPPNLMTTVMACRPAHPLFLLAIYGLPFTQKQFPNDILKSTGPFFLDAIYRLYSGKSNYTYFRDIKVLPPEYFLPTYDSSQALAFDRTCSLVKKTSPAFLQTTCRRWENKRRRNNQPTDKSYVNHYWVHVIMRVDTFKKMKTVPIDVAINTRLRDKKNGTTTAKPKSSKTGPRFISSHVKGTSYVMKYNHTNNMGWLPMKS